MSKHISILSAAMSELTISMDGQGANLVDFNRQTAKRQSEVASAMGLSQSIRLIRRDQIQREIAKDLTALSKDLKSHFDSQNTNTILLEQSAPHVSSELDYSTILAEKESAAFLMQIKSIVNTAGKTINSMAGLRATIQSIADLSPEIAIASEDLSETVNRVVVLYERQAKACEAVLRLA